jgi:ABC-type Mn2+/Zn2+ transport system ATPase subunit
MMFGHPQEYDPRPEAPLGNSILKVQDLTVRTRLVTIPDISVNVREGEVIGLAGLDGSGQVGFHRLRRFAQIPLLKAKTPHSPQITQIRTDSVIGYRLQNDPLDPVLHIADIEI